MRNFVRPPRLRPGATIGVAAISGPVDEDRLGRGVASLERRGYRVVLASNVRSRHLFLAGSDEDRAAGYRELLARPEIDAIVFARGGYGASRILRHLSAEEAASRPRIHLGGSDLTALFAWLGEHTHLVTFYGPMIELGIADDQDLDWERVLSGETPEIQRFEAGDVLAGGSGEGALLGGCLSLLASLSGTPEAPDLSGSVLFWEDVGEEAYRLDRMLTQLERSGTLDGLQAMIIGSISPGSRGGGETPEDLDAWLQDRFAGSPYPVVRGFPAGHLRAGRTLPLGVAVKLDADRGILSFSGPGTL